jgi:hypothetical protein
MLTVLSFVVAVASAVAASLSVLYVARQTRANTVQARVATQVAGIGALRESLAHLHTQVLGRFVDDPGLRRFFYDGAPIPTENLQRDRVLALAEVLADVYESTLDALADIEAFARHERDWMNSARFLLSSSPALRLVVSSHPWWPRLNRLAARSRCAGA